MPQQHQGDALAAQLEVHLGPVRYRAGPGTGAGLGEQHGLEGVVVQVSGQGPGEPSVTDRLTCSARVVGGTPKLAETWRRLMPSARVNRITSLILRMAMWGRGTGTSSGVVVDCPSQSAGALRSAQTCATRTSLSRCTETPGKGVRKPGTGVRNQSEWVYGNDRNRQQAETRDDGHVYVPLQVPSGTAHEAMVDDVYKQVVRVIHVATPDLADLPIDRD